MTLFASVSLCSPIFLVGLTQERNYRLIDNMPLLFKAAIAPILCQDTGFQACLTSGIPRALLTQVLPGCLGLSQPCKETLRVWSLILSVLGGFLDLHLELPPGSAVFSLCDFGPGAGSL